MQLSYLFHQYAKSFLSTDGRIADCTVRHPGVERPFSSKVFVSKNNKQGAALRTENYSTHIAVKLLYLVCCIKTFITLIYVETQFN